MSVHLFLEQDHAEKADHQRLNVVAYAGLYNVLRVYGIDIQGPVKSYYGSCPYEFRDKALLFERSQYLFLFVHQKRRYKAYQCHQHDSVKNYNYGVDGLQPLPVYGHNTPPYTGADDGYEPLSVISFAVSLVHSCQSLMISAP